MFNINFIKWGRQERDILREENQQCSEQLRIVREELINADVKLEKMRQKSAEANIQAQEILATERRRRLDAEEDARLHSDVYWYSSYIFCICYI